MGVGGCTGDELDARPDADVAEELRLGRVHVVLEPEADLDSEAEAFEVSARFAFVRGLEEDFVRARIDMPRLATEVVRPNDCVITEQLTTAEATEVAPGELQQVHLVDAGDIEVRIGDDAIEVPLIIRPDLLPYMSGVEYLYYGDELPSELSDEGGADILVEAKGSQTEEFPPFQAVGTVPAPLSLNVTEADLRELSRGALVLRWEGESDDELITVRLTGLQGGEPVGADLTCVFEADQGQTRLDFGHLRMLGLMLDAQALQVTASRLVQTQFDAGDFVGSELFIERREQIVLPLR